MRYELKAENRLSSPYTFFYKIVLPIIQLLTSGVFAFVVMLNDIQLGYIVIAIMIVILFVIFKYTFPLKEIWLGHDHIIVKNFSRRITVPLYSIVSVKENKWFNPHYVTIKLRSDTEFGQKITFIPDRRVGDAFQFLKDSKVTKRLKQSIEQYKKGTSV